MLFITVNTGENIRISTERQVQTRKVKKQISNLGITGARTQLTALVAPAEDLDSILSIYTAAQTHVRHTGMQNTHIKEKNIIHT